MDKRTIKINQQKLKEVLNYCPNYGTFAWINSPLRPVGYYNRDSVLIIQIYGKKFKAIDLAYLWMKGEWPDDEIVQYDADVRNFSWLNLEKRKKLGFKPLLFTRRYKGKVKYSYSILGGLYRVHGGNFDSKDEAIVELVKAVRSL